MIVGCIGKKNSRYSFLSNLFNSRFEKLELDPRVSTCEPSAATTTTTTATFMSSSSSSWFAAIFAGRMKKKTPGRESPLGSN